MQTSNKSQFTELYLDQKTGIVTSASSIKFFHQGRTDFGQIDPRRKERNRRDISDITRISRLRRGGKMAKRCLAKVKELNGRGTRNNAYEPLTYRR